jgi:hypothetical protein
MRKSFALAATLSLVALAGFAAPASARWWGDGRWHEDDRRWDHRYYGYHYEAPPVIYGTPYNYGYVAPPVIYNSEPGVSFSLHIP